MPVDPSIALQGQPMQLPNPLQLAIQGASLRNQTLEGNNLQKTIAANQAISQAIQHNTDGNGNVNLAGVQAEVRDNPAAGYGLQAATGTNLQQQGQQTQNQQDALDLHRAKVGWMWDQLTGMAADPRTTPDNVKARIMDGQRNGYITPDEANQIVNAPDFPQTNAEVRDYALRHKSAIGPVASQLLPNVSMTDNGQQIVPTNTNPLYGAPGQTPGQPVQKTLSPTTPTVGGKSGNQPGYYGEHPQTNQPAAGTTNAAGATTPDQNAIVQTESGGNANAVSPKGAMGPWQVMPNTLKNPGYGVTPARDNSPAELERVGHDYYTAMVNKYGNPTLGAIAYNMGPGAMDKWLAAGGQFEKLPQETRNYVGKVSTLTALNSRNAPAPSTPVAPANTQASNSGFVPSAPEPGVTQSITGNVDTVNNHWAALNGDAANAQQKIGILDNIVNLADKANVGTGSQKLALFNGILDQMGLPHAANVKEADDLLHKQQAMLSLSARSSGGGTDAAGAMAEAANPNSNMNAGAIKEAARQLQGQWRMALAEQQYLQKYKQNNDYTGYQNALTQFNPNADARIWQYEALPKNSPERAALAKQMVAADPKFLDKVKNLYGLGFFR